LRVPRGTNNPCAICGDPAVRERRHASEPAPSLAGMAKLPVCRRCDDLLKRKPRTSMRGRARNRRVLAPTMADWITALRRSWRISRDCFRCEISGLRLDVQKRHRPLSLTCDHDPPGSGKCLVVAWLINDMKNDHTREEFERNVRSLAKILSGPAPNHRTADAYHSRFETIEHWRRQ